MSASETVADRTPEDPVVLSDLATSLLTEASSGGSGTAATSLTPSDRPAFTQTVIAATSGTDIGADRWNGPASVQVITGTATVSAEGVDTELGAGQWASLGAGSGSIHADEDLVVLLTVAPS